MPKKCHRQSAGKGRLGSTGGQKEVIMKKRIASILLVLVMALSLIPTTVWARTSTVSTFEALKSRISSFSHNNPIEIVVDGTIEISETLNIRPTRNGDGHMAWYEFWNQNIIISGADADSKLVRAKGFTDALFDLQGEQGYSGYQGSDHPAYASLTLRNITLDGGGDTTTAGYAAIRAKEYSNVILEDGAVIQNCKNINNAGGAVYLGSGNNGGAATFTMSGTARMENNEAGMGGALYVSNAPAEVTISGGTMQNNTARKNGGAISCDASSYYSLSIPLKLLGGTIKNNTAGIKGGGVYFGGTTVCTVGGALNITGNTQGDSKTASNLHVGEEAKNPQISIGYGDDKLTSAASIGVNSDLVPTKQIVYGTTATNIFFSDRTDCALVPNGNSLDLKASATHTHCPCNNTSDSYHDHVANTTWTGINSLAAIKSSGNYYLLNDVTIDDTWALDLNKSNVGLCLNGHKLIINANYNRPYISIPGYRTLTLTDCGRTAGQIVAQGNLDDYGIRAIKIEAGGTFNMYGGEITGFNEGIAAVHNYAGKFNLFGGKITHNDTRGVYVEGDYRNLTTPMPKFNMFGGEISYNTINGSDVNGGGVLLEYRSEFNMSGGSIKNNTAGGSGGGIAAYGNNVGDATLTISGGEISGNRASCSSTQKDDQGGGGIYLGACSKLTLSDGKITGNYACAENYKETQTNNGGYGGGVLLRSARAFSMTGGEISGNHAGMSSFPKGYSTKYVGGRGGGVYIDNIDNAKFYMSRGSIKNNTADDCGGGVYFCSKGYVYLSNKPVIQGNTGKKGAADNLYLDYNNSKQRFDVNGTLNSGADIGISTSKALYGSETVTVSRSRAITHDEFKYFKPDRSDYEAFLTNVDCYVALRLKTYDVKIILPEGLTRLASSGELEQNCSTLTTVYAYLTDATNYYIPDDYGLKLNGLTVGKSNNRIYISGSPTADTTITLPAPTEKGEQPNAPTGLETQDPTSSDGLGHINNTTSKMEYRLVGSTGPWTTCGNSWTTAGAGKYEVRFKATDTLKPSPSTEVVINRFIESIPVPTPRGPFVYNGNQQFGLYPGTAHGYSSNRWYAWNVGTYTSTLTLKDGFKWLDGSTGTKQVQWEIQKLTPTAAHFVFKAPADLEYNGTAKEATMSWIPGDSSGWGIGAFSANKFTVTYKQNGKIVAAPTEMGTYQVYVSVANNDNLNAVSDLTDPSWTFTITHTGNHKWGEWKHNDTQHWQECTVSGCTEKNGLADHDGTATCTKRAYCSVCQISYGSIDPTHHNLQSVAAVEPTCTQSGNNAYWKCLDCGKFFADSAAVNEITDHSSVIRKALGHDYSVKSDNLRSEAANCQEHDTYWYVCAHDSTHIAKDDPAAADKYYSGAAGPHIYGTALTDFGADGHGYKCTLCDSRKDVQSHDFQDVPNASFLQSIATCQHKAVYYKSCTCGAVSTETFEYGDTAPHAPKDGYESDGVNHWHICKDCSEILGEKAPHAAADGWKSDKDGHWKVCKDCGAAIDGTKTAHTPDREAADYENPVLCTECGYEIAPVRPDVDVTVTIPFSMTVKKTGEAAPGKETFKLGFAGMMPDGLKDFVTIVNDTIETNGEKTYTGDFVFTVKASKLRYISDGIHLTQVKGSAEGWTYDETLYYVTLDIEDETVSLRDVSIMGEGDEFIPLDPKADGSPLVAFTNSYNASLPTPPVKTGDAGITLWVSLAALSGLVMLAIPELKKRKTHC